MDCLIREGTDGLADGLYGSAREGGIAIRFCLLRCIFSVLSIVRRYVFNIRYIWVFRSQSLRISMVISRILQILSIVMVPFNTNFVPRVILGLGGAEMVLRLSESPDRPSELK